MPTARATVQHPHGVHAGSRRRRTGRARAPTAAPITSVRRKAIVWRWGTLRTGFLFFFLQKTGRKGSPTNWVPVVKWLVSRRCALSWRAGGSTRAHARLPRCLLTTPGALVQEPASESTPAVFLQQPHPRTIHGSAQRRLPEGAGTVHSRAHEHPAYACTRARHIFLSYRQVLHAPATWHTLVHQRARWECVQISLFLNVALCFRARTLLHADMRPLHQLMLLATLEWRDAFGVDQLTVDGVRRNGETGALPRPVPGLTPTYSDAFVEF